METGTGHRKVTWRANPSREEAAARPI